MNTFSKKNNESAPSVLIFAFVFIVIFGISRQVEAAFTLIDHTEKSGINNWEKFKEGNTYREVFRYPGNYPADNTSSPHDYYWKAPSNIKDGKVVVELWGAGGNGGHGFNAYGSGGGSGGGAGGYIFANPEVTAGARYYMYIGAAGDVIYPNAISETHDDQTNSTSSYDDSTRLLGAGAGGGASLFRHASWEGGNPAKAPGDKVVGVGGGGGGVSMFFNPCYVRGWVHDDLFGGSSHPCQWKFVPWPAKSVYGDTGAWGERNNNLWVLSPYNVNIFNSLSNILYNSFTVSGKSIPEIYMDGLRHTIGTGGEYGYYEGYGSSVLNEKSLGGNGGKGVVVNRYPDINNVNDILSPDVGYYYLPAGARGGNGGGYTVDGPGGFAYGGAGLGGEATVSPLSGYAFGKGGDGKMADDQFGVGQNGGAVISYVICPQGDQNCTSIVLPPDGSFIDIGLRVNQGTSATPNIQKIAIESPTGTNTSPLMIAKNNKKYHVALVDPTDPDATKIIINAGSLGKKALRKYTGTDGITN